MAGLSASMLGGFVPVVLRAVTARTMHVPVAGIREMHNLKKTQKIEVLFFRRRVRNTKQQQNAYDEIFPQPHENPPEQAETQSR